MTASALIAIDWGTTLARAWRFDADGVIRERRSAPLGLRRIHGSRFEAALLELLGPWRGDRAPRIACGMVGSRQGWVEAPYVDCPASLAALAEHLVASPGGELTIVPGVATVDTRGIPDAMRGEETQLLGAVGLGEADVLAVLPGTHSKWARVDRGRVIDFATFMTGELYTLLLEHSMLGRLASGAPGDGADDAFARGVAHGLEAGELMHDLFGARTLALAGELAPDDVAEWLSGLLIGREIRAGLAWARTLGAGAGGVRIIGDDALADRYERALCDAGFASETASADAAAYGLWRIAVRAGWLAVPAIEERDAQRADVRS
ncbi:MAG TPA: 2-dehydro-3-deoxygalactonokinase [Casimicrobiaceae bacterium]